MKDTQAVRADGGSSGGIWMRHSNLDAQAPSWQELDAAPARRLAVLISEDAAWVLRVRPQLTALGLRCAWRTPGGDMASVVRGASLLWMVLRTHSDLKTIEELRGLTDASIVCTAPAHSTLALAAMERGAARVLQDDRDARMVAQVCRALLDSRLRTAERTVGRIAIDGAGRGVTVDGRPVTLTQAEFALLEVLSRRSCTVVESTQLAREALELPACESRALSVHICNLRRKLRSQKPSNPFFAQPHV